MTNNPTIDGVSRDLIERAISATMLARGPGSPTERDLRALLDAAVVEREPFTWMRIGVDGYPYRCRAEDHGDSFPVYRDPPEVAALQSTIAQLEDKLNKAIDLDFQRRETIAALEARIAELESAKGEPVAWSFKKYVWATGLGAYVWRDQLETERPDTEEREVKELVPLFTAPPAPVSVVLPERGTDSNCSDLMKKIGMYGDISIWQGAKVWNACLDATAALNEAKS